MLKTHSIVKRLYSQRSIVYFGDGASWHLGPEFRECPFYSLFWKNQPGLYSINYIEQIFSLVRYMFRARPYVKSYHQEVNLLYQVFAECNKFIANTGFERNHVRALLNMTRRFWPDIQTRKKLKKD